MSRYNVLLTGYSVSDEIITRTGSTALRIGHDLIVGTGFEIWTDTGKTGTKLTLTTDYVLSAQNTYYSASDQANTPIYTKFAIVNGTYQGVPLYGSYTTIGDLTSIENVQEVCGKLIQPLTAQISADTTYTLPSTEGRYIINIPKGYLYASTDVFRWLTITTGVSGAETIKIPILASSNSVYVTKSLTLNVYVDSSGNVTTDIDVYMATTVPYANYAGVVSTASGSQVRYDTKVTDTYGSVTTGASWRFTAPVSGNYIVSASIGSATAYNLVIYIDGAVYGTILSAITAGMAIRAGATVYMAAGSYLDIRCSQTTTAASGAIQIAYNGKM